jgi:hypothetical protein
MGRTRLEAWRGIKSLRVFGRFTSQGAGAMDVTSSFYRAPTDEARVLDVLRILHDAMDLARHLPEPRE